MRDKAKFDKEMAKIERMIIEDFRNKELGIPTLSIDEKQRKERQRAFIEEELLKGEEEEKKAAKEKVIHQMALCRAVVVFVLYFRCLNEFYFMLTKVQLLWLLHSSGPSPEYYTYNSFQVRLVLVYDLDCPSPL